MGEKIPDRLLSRLSEFVSAHMGLYFPEERRRYLEQGIASASADFGFVDPGDCALWLMSASLSKHQVEILASHLTVGETYFFREKKDFEIYESRLFADLIHARRQKDKYLRIWSAGCATGEEPYSIAILLSRMIPDLKDWHITILATDINSRFLKKASEGIYTGWSFRNTPEWVREGYFTETGKGLYSIAPHIKAMVKFSYLNLVEDIYPSLLNNTNAMDIVFCRNVLMYFSLERIKKAAQNIYKSLIDGGWLIVSPSETSRELFPQFAVVSIKGAFLYRKEGREQAEAPPAEAYDEAAELQHDTEVAPRRPVPVIPKPVSPVSAAVSQAPELQPSAYDEALALYEQGFYAEAAGKLAEHLAVAQDDLTAMGLLAKSYANQGELAEAHVWCEKAMAADKLNPNYYYLRANILQEQGQPEEAVKSLQQAVYLDPDFILAYFALGNLSRQQGKFLRADKYFNITLSLLTGLKDEEILPESEGVTAGRMREIIEAMGHKV